MLSQSYLDRFSGVGRLYGMQGLETIHKSHVMIIGLGGVGSWTAEALTRSGIGQVTLVDLDDLCITNTNRQIHAHMGTYGMMKAEALANRLLTINPELIVKTELAFYSERNSTELLARKPSVVIDAIDSVRAKCHLLATCVQQKTPIISCGGAGGKQDPTQINIADLSHTHGDPLLGSVRRTLRSEYGFPTGEGKNTPPFRIPTVFSPEPMIAPQSCDVNESIPESNETPRNLNCATGYGAITHITATFGFFSAAEALKLITV